MKADRLFDCMIARRSWTPVASVLSVSYQPGMNPSKFCVKYKRRSNDVFLVLSDRYNTALHSPFDDF